MLCMQIYDGILVIVKKGSMESIKLTSTYCECMFRIVDSMQNVTK